MILDLHAVPGLIRTVYFYDLLLSRKKMVTVPINPALTASIKLESWQFFCQRQLSAKISLFFVYMLLYFSVRDKNPVRTARVPYDASDARCPNRNCKEKQKGQTFRGDEQCAVVAKLAYAPDCQSGGLPSVRVRLPSTALSITRTA